jgi:hypothetical protein
MIMIEKTAIRAAGAPQGATDLVARHLTEALAVAAHGEEQRHHVLHRAGEDDADDDPDRAGQVAHLGGQYRPDERPGSRDRREVVAEQDPPVRRLVVHVVVEPLGGRGPLVVDPQHLARDEARIEAVGDEVRPERGGDQPCRRDLLAADEGDHAPCHGTDDRHQRPDGDRALARSGTHECPPLSGSQGPNPPLARV